MADKKLVQKTTNHFYAENKFDQKRLDADLFERIQAVILNRNIHTTHQLCFKLRDPKKTVVINH